MPDGGASQIRKGRKFGAVMQGAREVFTIHGFEGATVDDIARAAGVSKATIYSYFPDKKRLFLEMATQECRRQAALAMSEMDTDRPVRAVLKDIANRIVGFTTSDFGQRVFRLFVAECERFPDLGAEFYDTGPALVQQYLAGYFAQAEARGELRVADKQLAADQFDALCQAYLHPRMVFCVQKQFSDAEIARIVDGAVETFLARYGT